MSALWEWARGQVPLLSLVRGAAAAEARRVLCAAPAVPGDVHKALRVSQYLGDDETVPQFRFSIWSAESADAAVSLTEEEAERVAAFLTPPRPRRALLDSLRETLRL
jgi:hypothetical protein